MKPSQLDVETDVLIDWVERENDALERDIAALAGLEGDARMRASADIKRRQVRLKAALARCDAAMEELNAESGHD